MKTTYKHLSFNPRAELLVFKLNGISLRKIAARLGVHHATLSRELKRNTLTAFKRITCAYALFS
ncbi:MAG: helix-turn-helix domain-containing protein [Candidatus Omnitrophica bacterium]|nr:helix-turn-helix domain-containing protein [Candidatus Omnitrophota bacterium]